jgi:p-hydroxybenzoate 3-monooxygenase
MHVQVGIVGAGPAGLMLARLLHLQGISCVILESRSRQYVETRVRAGLLEQGSVDLINETGMGERLRRECLPHDGIEFIYSGRRHRINMQALIGRRVYIYGQQEAVKDMIAVNLDAGVPIHFEAEAISFQGLHSDRPSIRYRHQGAEHKLTCDWVAGCDGFHGVSRPSIPPSIRRDHERVYPFGWLGILVDAPPSHHELLYCHSERGFALFTMRSPTVSRLYLQVPPDEDENEWSDDRIWNEFRLRLGKHEGLEVSEGKITQRGVVEMRSFVCEPMRHERLFLAGDSAHIVPPTGAKGMNLAISDVYVLSKAFVEFYKTGSERLFESYTEKCLRRIWGAQHFSWWMTSMLHTMPDAGPFDIRRQIAELDTITGSVNGQKLLAENYAGLPIEM